MANWRFSIKINVDGVENVVLHMGYIQLEVLVSRIIVYEKQPKKEITPKT